MTPRDKNYNPVLLGQDSTDPTKVLPLKINPVTGRVLVEITGAGGYVLGPTGATNNAIVLFDGTSGDIVKDSLKTLTTSLGSDDATVPTSKAVKDVTDTKEVLSNKSTSVATDGSSDTKYPSVKSVKDYVDALFAPLISPALTGTPTAPTPSAGTNTTQLATTAFVASAIANLVASSPAALDTLNELASALGNDPNFATTVTNALAGKEPAISVLPISKGGTGSSTKNFVDLVTAQTITGAKTFTSWATFAAPPASDMLIGASVDGALDKGAYFQAKAGTEVIQLQKVGSGYGYGIFNANSGGLYASSGDMAFGIDNPEGDIKFATGGAGNERMRIKSSGVITGMFGLSQGQMINGKIVTFAASGNLTVSLKTLAGNDPSASDPVYVRIGNVVRSVTSALSATIGGGTQSWYNMGSSELAGKEVDMFLYIGRDSSSGTMYISPARIPYGRIKEDFNTSSGTNEKYAPFFDNLQTGDEVECIGRFNAILSGGAGYTWSIPATSVIVNRPIYETSSISPNITVGDGTNQATITVHSRLFKVLGKQAFLAYDVTINNKGSCSGAVRLKIPMSALATHMLGGLMKGGAYPVVYGDEMRFTNGTDTSGELYWSSVTNGDRFIVTGLYPIYTGA